MTDSTMNPALKGSILGTFARYALPSLAGLIAISTASLVDGVFVARYVGDDALAAVTVLVPYFTFLFGACLALAVGGCVAAGRALGEGDVVAASLTFSRTLLGALGFSSLCAVLALWGDHWLFMALGAPAALFAPLREYFSVIAFALVIQLTTMVLYYFVRLDGKPVLATVAVTVGALSNIALDALFVAHLRWGLAGAAWSTALAQCLQLGLLLLHFRIGQHQLRFHLAPGHFREVLRNAYGGLSEFVGEVSVGVSLLVLNWLLLQRSGVAAVSAFAVLNYLIYFSVMTYYGIADALHVLVSQNMGARKLRRARQFLLVALTSIALSSAVFTSLLTAEQDSWLALFGLAADPNVAAHALVFMSVVWPMFLVNGLNVLLTVYLTALQRPSAAAAIALCRTLLFPVALMCAVWLWWPAVPILVALPLAEWCAFFLAVALVVRALPASERAACPPALGPAQ